MDNEQNNIVNLDYVRIARGLGKLCKCKNRKFTIDSDNRMVTCSSCGAIVDPYEALYELAIQAEKINKQLERAYEQRKELESYKPHLRIIKLIESKYRGHKMIPICPRCEEPFYLEELNLWVRKEFADTRIRDLKK